MTERMGAMRYTLGYSFPDDEFFGTLTNAYLNAARIVGDYHLDPLDGELAAAGDGAAGDGDSARRPTRRRLSPS
jgi:hypothetical protein